VSVAGTGTADVSMKRNFTKMWTCGLEKIIVCQDSKKFNGEATYTMLKISRHGQRNTISIRIWNISINLINYKII
jgi:hypothetical protein